MESEEVHPQLGELTEDGLVIVSIPPVRALGKIVERMDAAEPEQRFPGFVDCRDFQGDRGVGDDIPVEVEAHPQFFSQAIGAVECPDLVTSGYEQNGALAVRERFQEVFLGSQRFDLLPEAGVGKPGGQEAAFLHDDDGVASHRGGIGPRLDGDKISCAEVKISPHLFRGQFFERRGVLGDDDGWTSLQPAARQKQRQPAKDNQEHTFFLGH